MISVKVKVENEGFVPVKAHEEDAGFDIYNPVDFDIACGQEVFIDTKVHMVIPSGYVGMIKSKSGLNKEYGITVEGVVDAGYTGTIGATVRRSMNPKNNSKIRFQRGDKLTQIVIMELPKVKLELTDSLEETERGAGGFGSTGR